MAEVVSEFFTVVWVDMIPPDNLAELVPYLLSGVSSFVEHIINEHLDANVANYESWFSVISKSF